MNFKKDYINYVLYNVLFHGIPANSVHGSVNDYPPLANNLKLKKILEKIINNNEIVKMTFLIGKTAGLEFLFKYLLYISDKIDKSQITIFNLKENFEYDVINLKKICEKIEGLQTEPQAKPADIPAEYKKEEEEIKQSKPVSTIKIDIKDEKELIETKKEGTEETEDEEKTDEQEGLTLIENAESANMENEVFELSNIEDFEESETATEEVSDFEEETEEETDENSETDVVSEEEPELTGVEQISPEEEEDADERIIAEEKGPVKTEEVFELDNIESEVEEKKDELVRETIPEIIEEETFEFEVKESFKDEDTKQSEPIKEETVTREAYIKFENRFFEDVKILEKLFAYINKEIRQRKIEKLSERMLQSFTQIIEISSELSDLSRQLSFDLTADIFFTINLFFTKAINNLFLLTLDKIKLLDASLVLVNSIIKNEDYLNFDELAEQIEDLKDELTRPAEKPGETTKKFETIAKPAIPLQGEVKEKAEEKKAEEKKVEEIIPETITERQNEIQETELTETPVIEKESREYLSSEENETALFKMKHFVKEFEKIFESILNIHGEYSKFDALEKIDDMNYCMRMLAKTAAGARLNDVLKLSEVSYVFLKYVKDYRMEMADSEIQQVIKYIIITFKILIKGRKTEDFNIFVEYLNTPVKIFTDSN